MSVRRIKYFMTQFSAVAVFFGLIWTVARPLARHFRWNEFAVQRGGSQWDGVLVVLVVIGLCWFGILAMVLWGRVLVVLGILTRDEARGYPYANPWRRRNEPELP